MKKLFLIAVMAFVVISSQAQNIQLHYDFGRNIYPNQEPNRQKVTITLEQFKADKWGSWFYFVDFDLSRKETLGAYTEISREFNVGKQGFAAHVEYNGGLGSRLAGTTSGSYQQAALLGAAYNGHNADFSTTWSVQLLYKRFFKDANAKSAYNSAQLTGVWGTTFAQGRCTFSGYIDFWRGEKPDGHAKLVILSESQFWYNITSHFSVGSEAEITNNFIFNTYDDQTFFVNPTLAVKWNF